MSEKYELSESACLQLVSVSLIVVVIMLAVFYWSPDPLHVIIALGLSAVTAAILAVSFEMKKK